MTPRGILLLLAGLFWLALAGRRMRAVQSLRTGDVEAARHLEGPVRQREIGAMVVVPTLAAMGLLLTPAERLVATLGAGWFRWVVLLGVLTLLTEAAGLRMASKAAAQAERGLDLSRTRRGARGADATLLLLAGAIVLLSIVRPV